MATYVILFLSQNNKIHIAEENFLDSIYPRLLYTFQPQTSDHTCTITTDSFCHSAIECHINRITYCIHLICWFPGIILRFISVAKSITTPWHLVLSHTPLHDCAIGLGIHLVYIGLYSDFYNYEKNIFIIHICHFMDCWFTALLLDKSLGAKELISFKKLSHDFQKLPQHLISHQSSVVCWLLCTNHIDSILLLLRLKMGYMFSCASLSLHCLLMLVLLPRTYLLPVFSVVYYQLKYFFLIVFMLSWMKVFIFIAFTVAFFLILLFLFCFFNWVLYQYTQYNQILYCG